MKKSFLRFTAAASVALAGSAIATPITINGSGTATGINSGFGDVLGATSSIDVTTDLTGLVTFTINQGPGDLNDAGVIYIDSISGGVTNTSALTDVADGGRGALSGRDTGGSDLGFAAGFGADYGISVQNSFAGLFDIATNTANFGFVSSVGTSGFDGTAATQTRVVQFNLSDIGLSAGDSFDFVVSYLNGGNGYRSDEFIGVVDQSGFDLDGTNVGQNAVNLAVGDFVTVNSVPEPASLALIALGGVAMIGRRRSA